MSKYFFDTIKKTFLVVAKEFSDIQITRKATDGSTEKNIDVELIVANKQKFYKRINQKSSRQAVVLPAISIWNSEINYMVERQRNPNFGNYRLEKDDNTIFQYLRNPSPMDFEFQVVVRTKVYSDMRQILETIVPKFQPKKTKSINLIPEMNVTLDLPIILESLATNFELESDEAMESVRGLEAEFTFRAESWIFPPIEEFDMAKYLKLNTDSFALTYTEDESPDSIVNKGLMTYSDIEKGLLKKIDVSDISPSGIYRLDFSDVISEAGEFFSIEDSDGNPCPFVFEYDNGECYGKDWMVPETLTLNKTNYVYIRAPYSRDLDETPETFQMKVYSSQYRNHMIAEKVLDWYDDFNFNTLSGLHTERKNEIDRVYIRNGSLFVKSTESDPLTLCKVMPETSLQDFTSCLIGMDGFDWEDEKIICGMTDEQEKYCYVRTSDTENEFKICEWSSSGGEVIVDTVVLASVLTSVEFKNTDGVVSVVLNTEDGVDLTQTYIIPWLGNNFVGAFSYDFFRGY